MVHTNLGGATTTLAHFNAGNQTQATVVHTNLGGATTTLAHFNAGNQTQATEVHTNLGGATTTLAHVNARNKTQATVVHTNLGGSTTTLAHVNAGNQIRPQWSTIHVKMLLLGKASILVVVATPLAFCLKVHDQELIIKFDIWMYPR